MGFYERKRPSCVKEVEVSSSSPLMRTGGKFCFSMKVLTHNVGVSFKQAFFFIHTV